jgi:hypothetical protein
MRASFSVLGWASSALCLLMLLGTAIVPNAQGQETPQVTSCVAECFCSSITLDCVSFAVQGCRETCDCTGIATPTCAFS